MTARALPVDGAWDPAFAAVAEAFAENLRERGEIGAAMCAIVAGRVVADLWGGHQDEQRTRPWQRDTLVNAYSVGKGITSMLALQLVSSGALALDAPVSRRWPEFAAHGKGETTLRMLLSHRAGLPAVEPRTGWAE